ncbi:MAG: helix-turn-helix domain-containing protein [Oscillospiraceae bacterium]
MTLGQRIQTILRERKIKQVDFAKTLGISANYVNLIANDKKGNISNTLAMLIEETYGYSARWVLNGTGEKLSSSDLTAERAEIFKKIQKMSDSEVKAILAFVNTLESINKQPPNEKN